MTSIFQQPKRRIPKANAPPIEITKPGEFNNGNIEVIQPETPTAPPPKMAVDEVLINGRRFRVPERVITMDFWNKTGKGRPHREEYVLTALDICITKPCDLTASIRAAPFHHLLHP